MSHESVEVHFLTLLWLVATLHSLLGISERDTKPLQSEYPWFEPTHHQPDIAAWARAQVESHVSLLGPYGTSSLGADVVHVEASMAALLSQIATRSALLDVAKAGAHAAYDENLDDHEAMGAAAWDALVAYAASTSDFVFLNVAQEEARTAAREVASARAPKANVESGSAGGDAGGSWIYQGRENGKRATHGVVARSLATVPGLAALTKAREKATETSFSALLPNDANTTKFASKDSATLIAGRIAGMASLEDEALVTVAWDMAHEAVRHMSWYTTWTPADASDNPWTPLLTLWRAGLGVFRLLDNRYLIFVR